MEKVNSVFELILITEYSPVVVISISKSFNITAPNDIIFIFSNTLLIIIGDVVPDDNSKYCKYKFIKLILIIIFPWDEVPVAK